jgi:preprotein translocase subunit SecD
MKARNRLSLALIVALSAVGLIATLILSWRPGLGLDLQGGASVLMKPVGDVRPGALEKARSIIEQRVNGQGIGEADVRIEGNRVLIEVPGVKDPQALLKLVGTTAELRFRPVVQEIGPNTPTDKPTATTASTGKAGTKTGASTTSAKKSAGTTTKSVPITKSVPTSDAAPTTVADLGGAGFDVVAQADTSVKAASPTLPPVSVTIKEGTADQTVKIGSPGTTVAGGKSPATTVKGKTTTEIPPSPTPTAAPDAGETAILAALKGIDPKTGATKAENDLPGAIVIANGIKEDGVSKRYILAESLANGEIVKEAVAEVSQGTGQWLVRLNMTDSGTAKFDQIAALTKDKQLAIVLDGVVQSAPFIRTDRFNGTAEISGSFTETQAKDLASVLRYGSLPVKLEQQQVQTVSASLGRDSLRAGILTGLLGLALVAAYMMFYYRSLGLVVVAGLLTSFGLLWTFLSLLTRTSGLALSLAGAVGIIVSVGVTVDSYVVYFERLRDEIRHGRSVDASIERGFKKAWHTILAADGVSILGAFVLYILTVGSVRGFALMLMISTALDMLVAWFFTRPLVSLLAHNKFFTTGKWGVTSSGSFGGVTGANVAQVITPAGTRDGIIRPGSAGRSTGDSK